MLSLDRIASIDNKLKQFLKKFNSVNFSSDYFTSKLMLILSAIIVILTIVFFIIIYLNLGLNIANILIYSMIGVWSIIFIIIIITTCIKFISLKPNNNNTEPIDTIIVESLKVTIDEISSKNIPFILISSLIFPIMYSYKIHYLFYSIRYLILSLFFATIIFSSLYYILQEISSKQFFILSYIPYIFTNLFINNIFLFLIILIFSIIFYYLLISSMDVIKQFISSNFNSNSNFFKYKLTNEINNKYNFFNDSFVDKISPIKYYLGIIILIIILILYIIYIYLMLNPVSGKIITTIIGRITTNIKNYLNNLLDR